MRLIQLVFEADGPLLEELPLIVLIVALLVGVQPPGELEVAAELARVGCGAHWGLPCMWIRKVKSLSRGGYLLEAALRWL